MGPLHVLTKTYPPSRLLPRFASEGFKLVGMGVADANFNPSKFTVTAQQASGLEQAR